MNRSDALEELSFIRQVMEDSRRVVVHDGRSFIVWGLLVAVGLCATYLCIREGLYTMHLWLWAAIVAGGWLWSYTDRRRLKNELRAETFAGRVLWAVWFAAGIAMTLMGVASFAAGVVAPYALPSATAFILGSGYFVTGRLMRASWVQALAVCWWIGGVVLLPVRGPEVLLLYAGMMLALQVVPGVVLQRRVSQVSVSEPA